MARADGGGTGFRSGFEKTASLGGDPMDMKIRHVIFETTLFVPYSLIMG
jgi:hypothetical protein